MACSRPGSATISGRVWAIADRLSEGKTNPAPRREVLQAAVSEGINPATANTQYGHWKRAIWPGDRQKATPLQGAVAERDAEKHAATVGVQSEGFLWSDLLKNGFTYCADWTLDASGALKTDRAVPDDPGVYVLVLDDTIVYIGVTTRTLHKRMADYRRGHVRQKTSARLHDLITSSLDQGKTIRIFCATPGMTSWNGFPVDISLGLERGLIDRMKPRWNKL